MFKPAVYPELDVSVVFNIVAVAQNGRLAYEAVLLAASLRASNPDFAGRLFIAVPQAGPLWVQDPTVQDMGILALLAEFGAEILPFESKCFGEAYPYGNKIECLAALPDEPFLFVDTDTVFTGSLDSVGFDFDRPSASMKREGTWPILELYGPGYGEIWGSLYAQFGLDFASSLDMREPDEYWKRYLYFNAGWFFHKSPAAFGQRFAEIAVAIRDAAPRELVCQPLSPWLDQVALPLVVHGFGGGRPGPELVGLDGDVTCHWRLMPLLYARESDQAVAMVEQVLAPNSVKKVLKDHLPFKKMVYQGKGVEVRAMFDRNDLPRREQMIRNQIKRANLWVR
ncbi:hypothetical protein SAMN05216227_10069 [Pseudorhodobacter antarcticus]|uniref:Uncharacterized protein n=1 Tax=Pseudorhodobacter antarcticus TaxID=1077947 RepID=A0A1H8CYN1_9RHOB|nr:hypothetical protein [Pseudorhodobacter antarcticus]SEN00321.1 hypothetical protein SAMN05216227_10069 [Pseudorhodobacter antarcticus]